MPATRTVRHAAAALLPLGMLAALAAPATSTASAAAETHKPRHACRCSTGSRAAPTSRGSSLRDRHGAARLRQPAGRRHSSRSRGFRRRDTAQRIGTVFVNPGGPGGSGSTWSSRLRRLPGRDTSTGASTSSASTHAASAGPIRCTASTARTSSTSSSVAQPVFPYQRGQYRPFFDAYALARRPVPRRQRADRPPHEHRRRRPRPGPAPPRRR